MNKTLYFLITVGLCACNPVCDDCGPTTPSLTSLFPAQVGRFAEFDISEQEYALGRAPVSRSYQLKEVVAESYTDASGKVVYRIARFRRADANQRWQADSTITLRLSIDQAVRNENGRDFVKMTWPLTEKMTWNANVFNSLGEDKYELRDLGKAFVVGSNTFDYSVKVIQQNDSTLVNQDKRIEVYAPEVGLVFKEKTIVQYCSSSPSCVGKNQIDYGIKQVWKLSKTGKE